MTVVKDQVTATLFFNFFSFFQFNECYISVQTCEQILKQPITNPNTVFLKMPKLKHCFSSKAAFKAKKQKRMERLWVAERCQQDFGATSGPNAGPDREERRCQQNTEAHQIDRLDPERRQEEWIRDSTAH